MTICTQCKSPFQITEQDRAFYQKIDIPDPQMCPRCRMQRRLMFRNFFNLYHRKCDLTGKNIISMYDDDAPFPVYEMKEWWSDKWSGLDYSQEVDLDRSIFEQIKAVHLKTPRMSIVNTQCENTDYCNLSFSSRNCYLVFGNVFNEDCCYGHIVWQSKNCFDCLYTYRSEHCYECTDCVQCFGIAFSQGCENCSDSKFLKDCTSCRNCFGCVGLKNKEYRIFNKEYTKEEYEKKIKEFNSGNIKLIEIATKRVQQLIGKHIVKHYHGINCENVTGDYLYNCKNTFDSYDAKNCEDIRYCATVESFNNSHDCNYSPDKTDWSYNCVAITGHAQKNCHNCTLYSANLDYCDNCYACKDCFGCAGLKNQKYCIFNKQYSKEEYVKLRDKLISKMKSDNEWGEFPRPDFSPFAYNETMANEYFPLTQQEVEKNGWRWKNKENDKPLKNAGYKIPDDIKNIDDDICEKVLICEKTGKHYKIIPKELEFLRTHNLPIPHLCWEDRHKERMKLRNPRILFDRKCAKCSSVIQTTYSPDRLEKVYCEECYLKGVY